MLLYCKYCGNKSQQEDIYCASCGNKLIETTSSENIDTHQIKIKWFLFLGIAVAVITLFCIAILLKNGKSNNKNEEDTVEMLDSISNEVATDNPDPSGHIPSGSNGEITEEGPVVLAESEDISDTLNEKQKEGIYQLITSIFYCGSYNEKQNNIDLSSSNLLYLAHYYLSYCHYEKEYTPFEYGVLMSEEELKSLFKSIGYPLEADFLTLDGFNDYFDEISGMFQINYIELECYPYTFIDTVEALSDTDIKINGRFAISQIYDYYNFFTGMYNFELVLSNNGSDYFGGYTIKSISTTPYVKTWQDVYIEILKKEEDTSYTYGHLTPYIRFEEYCLEDVTGDGIPELFLLEANHYSPMGSGDKKYCAIYSYQYNQLYKLTEREIEYADNRMLVGYHENEQSIILRPYNKETETYEYMKYDCAGGKLAFIDAGVTLPEEENFHWLTFKKVTEDQLVADISRYEQARAWYAPYPNTWFDEESSLLQESENDEYILPESNKRELAESELLGLSTEQLRIARNEIYARHGYIFTSEDLYEYFMAKSWYTPSIEKEDFPEDNLSAIEQKNRDLLIDYEMGMAQ